MSEETDESLEVSARGIHNVEPLSGEEGDPVAVWGPLQIRDLEAIRVDLDSLLARRMDDTFWRDRRTGKTRLASQTHDGQPLDSGIGEGAISGDGRFVAFDSQAVNLVPKRHQRHNRRLPPGAALLNLLSSD